MQDDCYLIAADGWTVTTYRVIETKKNKEGKVTKEVDKGWACDLIPKLFIVARYFAKEQDAIDQLTADLESVTARITEMEEEHGGEEGAFAELDKVNKANVTARLKEIKGDKDAKDEAAVLNDWLKFSDEELDIKKRLKDAEAELDAKAYTKYPKLTESEIKSLVVEDKWLAALDTAIHGEMGRVAGNAITRLTLEKINKLLFPEPTTKAEQEAIADHREQCPSQDHQGAPERPGPLRKNVCVAGRDHRGSEGQGPRVRGVPETHCGPRAQGGSRAGGRHPRAAEAQPCASSALQQPEAE